MLELYIVVGTVFISLNINVCLSGQVVIEQISVLSASCSLFRCIILRSKYFWRSIFLWGWPGVEYSNLLFKYKVLGFQFLS